MERCGRRLRFYDMMKRWIAALLAAAPVAAAAANIVPFPRVPPYLPVPKGSVVIMDTGSTNTAGYRIVVQTNAATEYISASGRNRMDIPKNLAGKMFSHLKAAAPLQNLPYLPCMKSASFGTSLFVWWNHQRSPDLTCVAYSRGKALLADATEIAAALHISTGLRRPIVRPMLPGEVHKPLPPAPSSSP